MMSRRGFLIENCNDSLVFVIHGYALINAYEGQIPLSLSDNSLHIIVYLR